MTDSKIYQHIEGWQGLNEALTSRLWHLELLIKQLKADITLMGDKLPQGLNNAFQESAIALEMARQQLNYLVNKQDEIEQQRNNKTLNIQEQKHEQ